MERCIGAPVLYEELRVIISAEAQINQYHMLNVFADCQKRKKSLRRKLDSLAKEKNKDKGNIDANKTPLGWNILVYFQNLDQTKLD